MRTSTSRIPAEPDETELRADAAHNRQRIVEVARELFATRGIDVPMAAIARHAGVGIATLYRRFPTKGALISEVFADQFATCLAEVEAALADPDPWHGFCSVIEKVSAMQAVDRGFSVVFSAELPDTIDLAAASERVVEGFGRVIRRAQRSGQLRGDFRTDDLGLLMLANSGVTARTAEAAPAASRRLVAYLLDSFRADRSEPVRPLPPPVPLDLADLWRNGD
jgi:AcrR family transcriptional regulator